MRTLFPPCCLLVAAALCAETPAPLTAPQKAFVAVVKWEVLQQAVRKALAENDATRAGRIMEEAQRGQLAAGLVVQSWPFRLGSAASPAKPRDPEPPVAKQSFGDLLPTLKPSVVDSRTRQAHTQAPEVFYVQFSRVVGALQEIEGRGAPYALAATLPATEADRVAQELTTALKVDDLPQWKRALPLALAGLAAFMGGAEKGLEASLEAYLKALPAFRPDFGHRPATREETVILGLGAIKVKLGKAPGETWARFQVLKSGLEDLAKKLKDLPAR